MKLIRTEDKDFDLHDFYVTHRVVLVPALGWGYDRVEKLENVIQADDETGLVVQIQKDEDGNEVYFNGTDEIAITNEVKVLLLMPNCRDVFLASGFRPKTSQVYHRGLRIVKRNSNGNGGNHE